MSTPRWAEIAAHDIDNSDEGEELSLNELGMKALVALRKNGKHHPMTIDELSHEIGYDIETNNEFFEILKKHSSIEYDDGTFRFKPEIDADSKEELVTSLRTKLDGVTRHAVLQSNENAAAMMDQLVLEGQIIGTHDEKSDREVKSIYPRLHQFKTQLSGTATVTNNSECVVMTHNVSREIRQGDAVIIEGQVYRVSHRPRHMPLSVSSIKSLDEAIDKHESKSSWDHIVTKEFYLSTRYRGPSKSGVPVFKFGTTNDIRDLWFDNCEDFYKREDELQKKIQDAHLSDNAILTTKRSQIKRTRILGTFCVC